MNEFIFENTSGKYHKFPQVYDDLNIKTVSGVLDRTITTFGRNKLNHRLKCVVSDPTDIQRMTKLNQTIYFDEKYQQNMREELKKIKKLENTVTRWMKSKPDENKDSQQSDENITLDETDDKNKNTDTDLFFKKGTVYNPYNIMNNRVMLTASNRFIMSSIVIVIFIYLFIYLYMNFYGFSMSFTDYAHGIYTGYVAFCKFMLMQIMSNMDWIETGAIILAVTYVGYQIYSSYKSAMICYEHYCLCSDFVDRYEKMVEFVKSVEEIYNADRYIANIIEDGEEKKIQESIEYLKSYFTKGSSLGYSLVSQISTYDYVERVNTLANYIGKIDMLISISTLLGEGGYTLPIVSHKAQKSYFEYDFPSLSAHNIWNPLLGHERSVKNSLIVNASFPNVVVLTGPNKAGKSTFMKSLMSCVYIAQSLGICPAHNMVFTPFRDLFTYLNIPDSIGRESLFEAEVNRCYDYLKRCEKLRGFSIGIIDELFTGTNPTEGMAGSYAILNQIIQNPANITIISTHFHDMLEKLDNFSFEFKKFTCGITSDNNRTKHTFDYKLKNGVSNQMIALSLLKEKGFDDRTIQNAHKFIQELKFDKVKKRYSHTETVQEDEYDDDSEDEDLIEKVRRLKNELDNEISENKYEPIINTNHLSAQYAKALAYSQNYNQMNGYPSNLTK
jgi:DNA mismatch repair ATPase MutS